ncbi:MAG: hypothetical protein M0P71_17360 [Melioribacteraceae bacterium]|nr:hypothetical protein [Melioribacteraceae bacterium]
MQKTINMKRTIILLAFLFIMMSCEKENDSYPESIITWKLETERLELYRNHPLMIIEFYKSNGLIDRYEKIDENINKSTTSYTYNESNQLIEYNGELFGIYRYYYKDELLEKKEWRGTADELQNYMMYEYIDNKTSIATQYDRNDNIIANSLYYYTINKQDSIIQFYKNSTDSILSIVKYKYDNSDNVIERLYYSRSIDNNELTLHTHNYLEYDEYNRVVKSENRDANNELIMYKFNSSYDSMGRLIRRDILNDDDEILGYYNITYSNPDLEYNKPEI